MKSNLCIQLRDSDGAVCKTNPQQGISEMQKRGGFERMSVVAEETSSEGRAWKYHTNGVGFPSFP